jgi:hypothetical protein
LWSLYPILIYFFKILTYYQDIIVTTSLDDRSFLREESPGTAGLSCRLRAGASDREESATEKYRR